MKSNEKFNPNKFDKEELVGKKFGKLTVISYNPERSKKMKVSMWNCTCECGNENAVISRSDLINGRRTDCGRCAEFLAKPGTRFGKLVVINQDPDLSKVKQAAVMHCKCDCGNDYNCLRSDLLKGNKTECSKCSGSSKRDREDITGQKFGMLTAIKYDEIRSKSTGKTFWECKCDCGNITYVPISSLKNGISTSCGCKRKLTIQAKYKIDMIGKKFGKLTVLSENFELSKKVYDDNGNIESTIPYYDCECDCGNRVTVRGSSLRNGSTVSCGYCYKRESLIGKVFGRLTVIEYAGTKMVGSTSNAVWKCKCICGNEIEVTTHALKSGNTRSCGCLGKDNLKSRGSFGIYYNELRGKYNLIHSRCYDPKDKYYKDYGGRGIYMDQSWLGENGLKNFYSDMIEGYEPGLTIDRINVNGPYSPSNCRWATRQEQNYNKRNNRYVDYYGKNICLAELADKFSNINGMTGSTISHRLDNGYTVAEALDKPFYTSMNKDNYFKNNPPKRKPFMFKEELDQMNIFGADNQYNKLQGKDLEKYLLSRPIAKDYWNNKNL